VTPFAAINDTARAVSVILDAEMMRHELLNYHPLDNSRTTTIGRDALVHFLEATGHPPRILAVSDAVAEQPEVASRQGDRTFGGPDGQSRATHHRGSGRAMETASRLQSARF